MTNNKIYSFLGLATKAGKTVSGEEACERNIKAGKAKLAIVSDDASDRTKKKFKDICRNNKIEIKIFGEKELLGKWIGKEMRSVVIVQNDAFAKHLKEMIEEINCNNIDFGGETIGKNKNI